MIKTVLKTAVLVGAMVMLAPAVQGQRFVEYSPSLTNLLSANPASKNIVYFVMGSVTNKDGGEGIYVYSAGSTESGEDWFSLDGYPGRFHRYPVTIPRYSTDPSTNSPSGLMWYNTTSHKLKTLLLGEVTEIITESVDNMQVGALNVIGSITLPFTNAVLVTGAAGILTNSTATVAEAGHLAGVTSAIQTQLNAIQATANSGYTNATNALAVATTAYSNSTNALTVRLGAAPVAVTFNATLPTDASLGCVFRTTLTGNFTLANPTNPIDGQRIVWELIQDGTGSRLITLGSAFALGTDISAVTLTTTASKRDFLTAIYNSTATKWYVTGFVKGY